MRITAKIATAGVAGLSRFPVANYTIEECTSPDGRLDPAKTRRALDVEQVQIGSKDDLRVLAFTLEYLTQQRSVVEKMAENMNRDGVAASVTDEKGVRTEATTPGDRRCERNMKRDRVVYVRTDVTGCADSIHVKLSVMNPRVVVGNAEPFAREYAIMCARILIYLREAITTARIRPHQGRGRNRRLRRRGGDEPPRRPREDARVLRPPAQRQLLTVQVRPPALPQRQVQRPDKGGCMTLPEHLRAHDGETTYDWLECTHKTTVVLAIRVSRAKADLFAWLEDRSLGTIEDDLVFHYFPRFSLPIELKGIAV